MFIDSKFCYIKSGVGMGQYEPTERHMSFCTWTLVPVIPEMLVRPPAYCSARSLAWLSSILWRPRPACICRYSQKIPCLHSC